MFRRNFFIERDSDLPSSSSVVASEGKTFYKCDFCDDGWQSESEVFLHKEIHTDEINKHLEEKKPVCLICIKTFETQDDLIQHTKTVHLLSTATAKRIEREIFICEECTTIFFNKHLLIAHMNIRHKISTRLQISCPINGCGKTTVGLNMRNHLLNSHKLQSVAMCPICLTKMKDQSHLSRHIETHPLYLRCNFCSELHTKLQSFNQHVEVHRKKIVCKKPIRFKQYFAPKHNSKGWSIKIAPANGLKLPNFIKICVLCREICTSKEEMIEHVLNHRLTLKQDNSTLYMCCCGEEFSSNILLKHHIWKEKDSKKTHKQKDVKVVRKILNKSKERQDLSELEVRIEHLEEKSVELESSENDSILGNDSVNSDDDL